MSDPRTICPGCGLDLADADQFDQAPDDVVVSVSRTAEGPRAQVWHQRCQARSGDPVPTDLS